MAKKKAQTAAQKRGQGTGWKVALGMQDAYLPENIVQPGQVFECCGCRHGDPLPLKADCDCQCHDVARLVARFTL